MNMLIASLSSPLRTFGVNTLRIVPVALLSTAVKTTAFETHDIKSLAKEANVQKTYDDDSLDEAGYQYPKLSTEGPKRPFSAYFQFKQKQFSAMRSANPGVPVKQCYIHIGKMWKEMDDSSRLLLIVENKKRYAKFSEDYRKWKATWTDEDKEKMRQYYSGKRGFFRHP